MISDRWIWWELRYGRNRREPKSSGTKHYAVPGSTAREARCFALVNGYKPVFCGGTDALIFAAGENCLCNVKNGEGIPQEGSPDLYEIKTGVFDGYLLSGRKNTVKGSVFYIKSIYLAKQSLRRG